MVGLPGDGGPPPGTHQTQALGLRPLPNHSRPAFPIGAPAVSVLEDTETQLAAPRPPCP